MEQETRCQFAEIPIQLPSGRVAVSFGGAPSSLGAGAVAATAAIGMTRARAMPANASSSPIRAARSAPAFKGVPRTVQGRDRHHVVQIAREHEPTAQVKAMVETKNYTWDVVTLTLSARDILHPQDLLEPLDWNLPDMNEIMPEATRPGVDGHRRLLHDPRLSHRQVRQQRAEELARLLRRGEIPGPPRLRKHPIDTLETALLADGVGPTKLYPLDVDRAFKKLDQIKPHVAVWWTGGAQTTQLLQSGEVDMIPTWNARAQTVIDAGGPVKIHWNQGLYSIEGWGIAEGQPQGRPRPPLRRLHGQCQAAGRVHASISPTGRRTRTPTSSSRRTAPSCRPRPTSSRRSSSPRRNGGRQNRQKAEERFTAWMLT